MLEGMGQKVTVLREQKRDAFGGKGGLDESHDLYDVLIDVDYTKTETDRETVERTTGSLWFQFGSDIKAGDHVQFFDESEGVERTVRIDGRPEKVMFGGFDPGIRARFKEIGGETNANK